jgi:hypothetical protein
MERKKERLERGKSLFGFEGAAERKAGNPAG